MRIRTRTPGNANPITLGILFAVVGGITFFVWGLPPLKYSNTSKSWPSVPGTITKSEIDIWRTDGKTHYQPKIVYAYTVDGKKYSSSKITVGDPPLDNNITPAKRLQQEYPVDKTVDVWYDPEVPASSALKTGIKTNDLVLAAITGLFFIVGMFVLYSGLKAKRRAAEVKNAGINQQEPG